MYEQGQQIRRSTKSVRSMIVEGYGRKRYPKDYLRFLIYALGSNDESIDHLEILWETKSLKNEVIYQTIRSEIDSLGKMLHRYIQFLEKEIYG